MVDTRWFLTVCWAVAGLFSFVAPLSAEGAKSVAIFPFELIVERQNDGDIRPPTATDEEKKRLLLLDKKLQELLESSGKYSRVDLSAMSEKITEAAPLHQCNGCDVDLAKEAGAELYVLGLVRKSTRTLIQITIFVRESEGGKPVKAGAVSIRENDDAGWLRGVRSIVRNKILSRARR